MWIHLVVISCVAILGPEVYVDGVDCGKTTLSADATQKTLNVTAEILSSPTPCEYTITGKEGEFVKIDFQKAGAAGRQTACEAPFVKLTGVTGEVKTEIATLCKTVGENTYYSPGAQMIVTIQGKAAPKLTPFSATYQSVSSVTAFCGNTVLTAQNSAPNELKAPAKAFQGEQICVYTITAQPGEVVEIKFEEIADSPTEPVLPEKASDATDTPETLIRLENFKDGVQTLIANIPAGEKHNLTHTSTDETMIVTLFGSTKLTQKLFTAVYKSVTDPYCGLVNLEAKEQSSTEWKFPLQTIKSARDCTYKIQAAEDQKVQLDITALNFGTQTKEGKCSAPYLELKNSADSETTPIKDICETKVPQIICSNTSAMIVKLHGADNLKQHAVTATYKAVKDAANNVLLSFSSLLITALVCLF